MIRSRRISSLTLAMFVVLLTILSPTSGIAASGKSSAAIGASLFKDKGCAYCHGAGLEGTERGPSLLNVHAQLKSAQIAEQIKHGGQKMPPFGDTLSPDEIMQLVSFLRAKHLKTDRPLLTIPPPVTP